MTFSICCLIHKIWRNRQATNCNNWLCYNGVIVMTVCSNAQVSFHISLSSDWSCCRGKLVATRVGKTCIANIHTVCTQYTHIHAVKYHPPLVNDQQHFKRLIIFQISNQIYKILSAASSFDNFSASTSCRVVQGEFLTVPPDFHYQYEKRVATNQSYFFKTFSM